MTQVGQGRGRTCNACDRKFPQVILSGHQRPLPATTRREGSQDDGLDTGYQGPGLTASLQTPLCGVVREILQAGRSRDEALSWPFNDKCFFREDTVRDSGRFAFGRREALVIADIRRSPPTVLGMTAGHSRSHVAQFVPSNGAGQAVSLPTALSWFSSTRPGQLTRPGGRTGGGLRVAAAGRRR